MLDSYLLSRKLAQGVLELVDANETPILRLEDVTIAIAVSNYVVGKLHLAISTTTVHSYAFLLRGCDRDAIVSHYIAPEGMNCIFQRSLHGHANSCCPNVILPDAPAP